MSMYKPDDTGERILFNFTPEPELSAEENLKDFISKCRKSCERMESFDELTWPSVAFSKIGTPPHGSHPVSDEHRLDRKFLPFAKAYLWYRKAHNPKLRVATHYGALRLLERALLDIKNKADVSLCNIQVLDQAVVVATAHYQTGGSAYLYISYLKQLADFIEEHGLSKYSLYGWGIPIRRPIRLRNKLGREGKEYRQSKLPNDEALDAIAEIFASNPQELRDILSTSFYAMAMCAPSRAHEILGLPITAEVTEIDKNGVERYGWRFFSGKGFGGDIKWITKSMEEVAKEAFKRVADRTAEGRKFATWVHESPSAFYRHKYCPDVDDNQPLTIVQAAHALGYPVETRDQARTVLNSRDLKAVDGAHNLRSLWSHIISRLPDGFPWVNQHKKVKYGDALFCLLRYQVRGDRETIPNELQRVYSDYITHDYAPRFNKPNIFERYGYIGKDGGTLRLKSHQARHMLNSIASRAGLSQDYIAKWSGRTSVQQNRVYNHSTDSEICQEYNNKIITSDAPATVAIPVRVINPLDDEDFENVITPAMHLTDGGYCIHNFVISPCMLYRDCDNCEEQICIKGDQEALERARLRLSRYESVLALAFETASDDDIGADRWIAHHKMTIDRLRQFVQLLSDDSLEDGAIIRLSGGAYSIVKRALINGNTKLLSGRNDGQAPKEN